MFSKLTIAVLVLLAQASFAYDLSEPIYDSATQTLSILITYNGTEDGHKEKHQFDLQFDSCNYNETPTGAAAVLLDNGSVDTGTEEIKDRREFNLSGLECKPAMLTIRAGVTSHISVYID